MYYKNCHKNVAGNRWRTTAAAMIVAIVASGALTVPPALATTYVWDRPPSHSPLWSYAEGWSPVGVPGADDDVEFVCGTYGLDVLLESDQSCNSITYFGGCNWLNDGNTLTITSGNITFANGTSSTPVFDNDLILGNYGTWDVFSAHTLDINGSIGGSGGFDKTGTGTVRLDAANTFSGTTTVTDGLVILGNALALQNSDVILNTNDGIDEGSVHPTLGSLAGSGNWDLGDKTLTVGGSNATSKE